MNDKITGLKPTASSPPPAPLHLTPSPAAIASGHPSPAAIASGHPSPAAIASGHPDGAAAYASAPGKVILFGEHFVVHGTNAILCAINRRVSITATETKCGAEITSRIGTAKTDSLDAPASSIRAALRPLYYIVQTAAQKAGFVRGIRLDVTSEIPPGAGLGSSSACCAAGAAAVLKLLRLDASRKNVLKMAVDAERTVFPGASGADTAASVLGGMIIYNRKSGCTNVPLNGPPGFGLLIADSGTMHDTDCMVRRVEEFRTKNPSEFARIYQEESRLLAEASEMLRRGHESHKAAKLGRMATLNQSHLEAIGVSNDRLCEMISEMRTVTYGAKITGAGGGGCAIAFVRDPPDEIPTMMAGCGYDCFAAKIDFAGLVVRMGRPAA